MKSIWTRSYHFPIDVYFSEYQWKACDWYFKREGKTKPTTCNVNYIHDTDIHQIIAKLLLRAT